MKKFILLFLSITSLTIAQKKEKIKGSRKVTIENKSISEFDALEVQDELEVILVRGDKSALELEADDNLQDVLSYTNNGNLLILSAFKDIRGHKKFAVRVTYTDSLKTVLGKNKCKITAVEAIKLNTITLKATDDSKMFINSMSKSFVLTAYDNSYVELNDKSENCSIELSNDSELKGLISTTELKFDQYQKSEASVEGDAINMKLRLDKNARFSGKKMDSKNVKLVVEDSSKATIFADKTFKLEATGDSETELYGNPKIEIEKFNDTSKLFKKKNK
jgi:Putative auto-transporter adhesin, head GIN domain